MEHSRPFYLLLVGAIVMLTLATSPINGETDEEYWKRRSEEAQKFVDAAYVQDPFLVTDSFNVAVHKTMSKDSKNSTRRGLSPVLRRSCKATNPIDRCWRCRADWANDRMRLQGCAKGFGRHASGGGPRARIYVVTDNSDNNMVTPKVGTLRHAVIQNESLWIVFARDMLITLKQELLIAERKTIDGRGARVEIAYGAGLTIQNVDHVIIHGIHIHNIGHKAGGLIRDHTYHFGIRTKSDGDGISILKSANIWIDHVTMYNCEDGLIDMIDGSTAITISNSHFHKHDKAMLLGARDEHFWDDKMQVTVAFNRFGPGLRQRMPRVRFGFVHVVNNDYFEWGDYCIGGSMHPTILSQGNKFNPDPNRPQANEVTKREYRGDGPRDGDSWNWTSDQDYFLHGATFQQSGSLNFREHIKRFSRAQVFTAKSGVFAPRLTRYAGALACKVGEPC